MSQTEDTAQNISIRDTKVVLTVASLGSAITALIVAGYFAGSAKSEITKQIEIGQVKTSSEIQRLSDAVGRLESSQKDTIRSASFRAWIELLKAKNPEVAVPDLP
jgi:hypothetical protein